MGHQSAGAIIAVAKWSDPPDLAGQPNRRDLPLSGRRSVRLQRDQPENHPELDPQATVQGGAGGHRRHRLGGKTKTYEITVDLDRLLAQGITLPQVLQALNNSNINVGGQT